MTTKEKYNKSEKGVITSIWSGQKSHSKYRGHTSPNYTNEQLVVWLYDNNFKELFDNWVLSGYDRNMKPSVDRLNDRNNYNFENIQLLIYIDNMKKTKQLQTKRVSQILDEKIIKVYNSVKEAFDETSIRHISDAARKYNGRSTAGGFKWEYV